MGKRFAPAYANIYKAEWEEKAFKKCHLLPKIYLKYLDDIFRVLTELQINNTVWTLTLTFPHIPINKKQELKTHNISWNT